MDKSAFHPQYPRGVDAADPLGAGHRQSTRTADGEAPACRRRSRLIALFARALTLPLLALGLVSTGPGPASAQTIEITGVSLAGETDDFKFNFGVAVTGVEEAESEDYVAYVSGIPGDGWTAFGLSTCIDGTCLQTINAGARFAHLDVILLSALAELVYVPTGEVIDRDHYPFIRPDKQYTIIAPVDKKMGLQVTDTGLDAFAKQIRDILPPDDFAETVVQQGNPRRSIGGTDDALVCVNLKDLDSGLVTLPGVQGDYNTVIGKATLNYGQYQAALAAGFPLLAQRYCVQTAFFALHKNWEVCIRDFNSELVDLDVDALVSASLRGVHGDGPSPSVLDGLALDAKLGEMDLEIDVTLADMYFQWAKSPLGCNLSPSQEITSTAPEFEEWATCRGLGINIASPSAKIDDYEMSFVGTQYLEEVAVDGLESVDIDLVGTATTSTDVGQCGLPDLNPHVEDVVAEHLVGLDDDLETAWLYGSETAAADVMNDILSTFSVGERDTELDVELSWNTDPAVVDPHRDPLRYDGFTLKYRPTTAHVRPEFDVANPPFPALMLAETDFVFSRDGRTNGPDAGQVFDVGFTISTNNLNQILLRRAETALLNFTVELPAASGTGGSGNTALTETMSEPLELRVSPRLQPFVWLPPDANEPKPITMTHQIMGLKADLVRPGATEAEDEVIANMLLDFAAPEVQFSLSNTGSEYLDFDIGDTHVELTVLHSDVPACPMKVHDASHVTTCEGYVTEVFETLFEPSLVDVMEELLSEVPGPNIYDARGTTTACEVIDRGYLYSGQRATLYADLEC